MSEKIRFTGNSLTYGVEIDGERVTFSQINLSGDVLDLAENVELSGGNLTVKLPQGVNYSINVEDDIGQVVIQ